MNSSAALARQAGMTDAQWKEAVKFDSTDWGWIIMSIGMAIGAGIVFLPVQVGLDCLRAGGIGSRSRRLLVHESKNRR